MRRISWGWMGGRRTLLGSAAAMTVLAGAACDSLTHSAEREVAEVSIDALASASSVRMITSTVFSVVEAGDVVLIEADTQVVSLPLLRQFTLEELNRFYISIAAVAAGDTASVRMQVKIDGKSWFDEQRTLSADSTGVMTFVYRFSQPGL